MKKIYDHFIKHPWLFAVAFTFGMMGMQIAAQGLLVTRISKALDVPISSIVFYDSFSLVVSLLINALSGKVILRLGEINIRNIAMCIFCMSNIILFGLLYFTALEIEYYIALQIFNGVALGLIYPALNNPILRQNWAENLKSSILALVNVSWSVGFFCAAQLLYFIAKQFDVIMLLLVIATGFFLALLQRHPFSAASNLSKDRLQAQSVNSYSQEKLLGIGKISLLVLLLTGIPLLSTSFSQNTIEYWFPSFLEINKNFSIGTAAAIVSFFSIGQAVGRLVLGIFFLPWVNVFNFIKISFLSLAFLIILFLLNKNEFLLCLILLGVGLSSSCLLPAIMSLGSVTILNYNAHHTSFLIFMNSLGSSLGLLVTSIVGQQFNHALAISVAPVLLIANILLVNFLRSLHFKQENSLPDSAAIKPSSF